MQKDPDDVVLITLRVKRWARQKIRLEARRRQVSMQKLIEQALIAFLKEVDNRDSDQADP